MAFQVLMASDVISQPIGNFVDFDDLEYLLMAFDGRNCLTWSDILTETNDNFSHDHFELCKTLL